MSESAGARRVPEDAETAGGPTGDEVSQGARGSQDESAKAPEELERDIEQTREELGDTVDALAQKADVKTQLKGAADEQKTKLRAKQEEIKQKFSGAGGGGDSGPRGGEARERAKQLQDELVARTSRQPLPYLAGALVAGLLIGLSLRGRTR
jgi:chromosome condensin MukBEF ATPase and DNA-binding subunit MukB